MRAPPYTVVIPVKGHYSMLNWCAGHFGPRWDPFYQKDGTWTCFWGPTSYKWHFAREEDLVLFLLRWA